MKKIILRIPVLVLILFSVLVVHAQQDQHQNPSATPEQRAEKIAAGMKDRLELTDQQSQKVYDIILENQQAREKAEVTRKAERDAMDKKLSEVLTPEQMEKLKANRSERMEKAKNLNRGKGSGKAHCDH